MAHQQRLSKGNCCALLRLVSPTERAMLHLCGLQRSRPTTQASRTAKQRKWEYQQQAAHEAKFQSLLLSSSFSSCDCCGSIIMELHTLGLKYVHAHRHLGPGSGETATPSVICEHRAAADYSDFSRIFAHSAKCALFVDLCLFAGIANVIVLVVYCVCVELKAQNAYIVWFFGIESGCNSEPRLPRIVGYICSISHR